ncbi:MAG: 16S rRNA (guanine(966)-N(2))-methyltransferase RsmD [Gemmatimonadaceae bacterium]
MRIVGGRWRGRRIAPPDDDRVRPTGDRVREAWMSIVQLELRGARVLDLFAGSGALGLEALSRGAARAEFVDSGAAAVRAIRDNAAALGALDGEVVIHRADALGFLGGLAALAFDVAFADPPYRKGLAGAVAEAWLAVPFAGVMGVEHGKRDDVPPGGDTRRYGDTAVTFYRAPR